MIKKLLAFLLLFFFGGHKKQSDPPKPDCEYRKAEPKEVSAI